MIDKVEQEQEQGTSHADLLNGAKIKERATYSSGGRVKEFNYGEKEIPSITLKDDDPAYFEIILEYMMAARIETDAVKVIDLNSAIAFMQYVSKYDLPGASDATFEGLRAKLKAKIKSINDTQIESVFKMTVPGSPLRGLIVQAALSIKGLRGIKEFSKLESTVDGYANELLVAIRACLDKVKNSFPYMDALSNTYKRY